MAVGKSLITADGINALANASASGTSVKPKYFQFSSQDLVLDPNLSAGDIVGWITQDINLYQKIDDKTVEFVCDVKPTEATDYARVCGLYLDDGTLFMVAKPPYPFPPLLRQTFKIQMKYEGIDALLNFKYVSFNEEEQSLSALDTSLTIGLESMQSAKMDGLYKYKMLEVSDAINYLKSGKLSAEMRLRDLERRVKEDELGSIDTHLGLGLQAIQNAKEIGLIKSKIGVM